MTRAEAREIADWIEAKAAHIDFGELHVVIKIHAGREDLIEQTVTEKRKAGITGDDYGHRNR